MNYPLRLLAIFPHPDDETLGLGGTLARYRAEGIGTYLLCATHGERGWNGPEDENPGFEMMARIREAELGCAAGHLGLTEVWLLDYIDGEVEQANPAEIIGQITSLIRRVRPQVVVTFGPDGSYGHPDHIALAQFSAGALLTAADPAYRDPEERSPHRVSKYYQLVDSKRFVAAVQDAIGTISMEVDGVERRHFGWDEWAITTRLDTAAWFETVWQAVLCHQSQLPGYGPMIDLPQETLRGFWSEATFIRIFSLVNGGRVLEDDLFAGLR